MLNLANKNRACFAKLLIDFSPFLCKLGVIIIYVYNSLSTTPYSTELYSFRDKPRHFSSLLRFCFFLWILVD